MWFLFLSGLLSVASFLVAFLHAHHTCLILRELPYDYRSLWCPVSPPSPQTLPEVCQLHGVPEAFVKQSVYCSPPRAIRSLLICVFFHAVVIVIGVLL